MQQKTEIYPPHPIERMKQTTVIQLCEICGAKIDDLCVIWRRGFVTFVCFRCNCKLFDLLTRRVINFSAAGAQDIAAIIIKSDQRPFAEAANKVLHERQELWQRLAAQ